MNEKSRNEANIPAWKIMMSIVFPKKGWIMRWLVYVVNTRSINNARIMETSRGVGFGGGASPSAVDAVVVVLGCCTRSLFTEFSVLK